MKHGEWLLKVFAHGLFRKLLGFLYISLIQLEIPNLTIFIAFGFF